MQEQHITVDGSEHRLEAPFLVIATQNPIEFEGTYPLPEAQLDRFIMRIAVGYPEEEEELRILMARQERKTDQVSMEPVLDGADLLAMQEALEQVYVSEPVGRYIVSIIRGTRSDNRVGLGASPRGALALFKLSRASALLDRRDFVTPEDVKRIAVEALAHRVILKPEVWIRDIREQDVVADVLRKVPVPPTVE
jgi:MoxR-like ATPase